MTNHWIDIKNSNCVLIMGSNAAEHHPISMKWILRAKDNGATLIHVDPKFSRTSARCDYHVPLRSGSDIAFLGGMINYILENKLYQKEYVLNYTNASVVVGKDYDFKDGLLAATIPRPAATTRRSGLTRRARTVISSVTTRGRIPAASSTFSRSIIPDTP